MQFIDRLELRGNPKLTIAALVVICQIAVVALGQPPENPADEVQNHYPSRPDRFADRGRLEQDSCGADVNFEQSVATTIMNRLPTIKYVVSRLVRLLAVETCSFVADELEFFERCDLAIAWRKSEVDGLIDIYGESHHRVVTARWSLSATERVAALDATAQSQFARRTPIYAEIHACSKQGQFDEQISLNFELLAIYTKLLGEQHPYNATTMHNLAWLYAGIGYYAKAESLYRQSLAIKRIVIGELHPSCAVTQRHLARLYRELGDYTQAEPLLRQAVETERAILGEEDSDFHDDLTCLGDLYQDMGDYAKAESAFREAIEIAKKTLGEDSIKRVICQNNLAYLYVIMGDYAKAETLVREEIEIVNRTNGQFSLIHAECLEELAFSFGRRGDRASSGRLLLEALEIKKSVYGEHNVMYAQAVYDIIFSDFIVCNGIEDARVESLLIQSLDIQKKAHREDQELYAKCLHLLAVLSERRQPQNDTWPLLNQAWSIYSRNRDKLTDIRSERQQLEDARGGYTILQKAVLEALEAHRDPNEWYPILLAEKGRVTIGQRREHEFSCLQTTDGDKEATGVVADLRIATRRLSTLSKKTPPPDRWLDHIGEIEDLSKKIEELQKTLSERSAAYRHSLVEASLGPGEIGRLLPKDAALVDIFRLGEAGFFYVGKEDDYFAIVTRGDRPSDVEVVRLGATAPIDEAVDVWRGNLGVGVGRDAGEELRRLVWAPIEAELSDEITTVLVSPEGGFGWLTWGALPGKEPGSYLIEERAFATLITPQFLAEYVGKEVSVSDSNKSAEDSNSSLLLVGDVAYGGDPGTIPRASVEGLAITSTRATAARGETGLWNWDELDATRQEIVTIRDSFEQYVEGGRVLATLRKENAKEEAVRIQAPKATHLHFATHGYFAPASLHRVLQSSVRSGLSWAEAMNVGRFRGSDIRGYNPGLLSGIVLAGANQPIDPDKDDGILTATEVAELDLHRTRLAVLSACETGLGVSAGGEGLLGLQRAFQVAGCRSVIATMWKIPDEHSRSLMVEFYENLWAKKQPTLMALRNAQLSMLREGRKRGLAIDDAHPSEEKNRLPPYYWAGFVLSGAWE